MLRSRGTILVVEDDDGVRDFVRIVLEHTGYAVLAATSAEQALDYFRADPDRVDLVLSDVMMPNRTGPELAAELRQLRADVRVVFMSGYTGELSNHHPNTIAGALLLEKPFSLDRLLNVVESQLSNSQPHS